MKWLLKLIFTSGLLALMCIFCQTCKRDPICCLGCGNCENFPKKQGVGISEIIQKNSQKKSPCFNPINPEEIIYVKVEGKKHQLIKYNLQFNSETVLIDNTRIVGQPKWGKAGWIVFVKSDLNIYLIKDNGDSIRQITSYFENNHPSFLGIDKFFFSVGAETSPGASGNKIVDFWGNRLDSIKPSDPGGFFWRNDINNNKEVASMVCSNGNKCSISIHNISSQSNTSLNEFESSGSNDITGIFWHPNNNDIFYSTYREGLFKVNKNSKTITKIRCGCDSRSYRNLSISPDGQKIIVERVDATDYTDNPGSWTEEAKIYIMDIDGKNEKNVFE
jgi:hypothetical protein